MISKVYIDLAYKRQNQIYFAYFMKFFHIYIDKCYLLLYFKEILIFQ